MRSKIAALAVALLLAGGAGAWITVAVTPTGPARCTVTVSEWNPGDTSDRYSFTAATLADAKVALTPVRGDFSIDCTDGTTESGWAN